jgi:predicted nuclease of restriction endonuclease-like RecB superfamily
MRCTIQDIRFTVRRSGAGDPTIYPRLLRDRSILPKIAFAIDYFEGLVGRERRDLDAELLVSFFGDHKLARCVVAALGRTYRFRARRIEEVVTKVSARRLARHGIAAPKLLRLALFDDVNEHRGGFTTLDDRDAACGDLALRLKVRPAEVERVLYLDLDEHAVLQRVGPRAQPEDVAAQFNLGVLETLLRQAESVDLHLSGLPSGASVTAAKIGAAYSVAVAGTAENTLQLSGRQDALGNWSRHGRRLARVALEILERGQAGVLGGVAVLALPNRRVRMPLTSEILGMLSAPNPGLADWQDDLSAREVILERVDAELHRRPGSWSLRRQVDPQAGRGGVLVPDRQLRARDQVVLLGAVRSLAHGTQLARLVQCAVADPYVFVGADDALPPLRAAGATCIRADDFDATALEAAVGALGATAERPARRA